MNTNANRLAVRLKIYFLFSLLSTATTVNAAELIGAVHSDSGTPLAGAIVRIQHTASGLSESVYSAKDGTFALTTELHGELSLRIRAPYHKDHREMIKLASESRLKREVRLHALTTANDISESLPAVFHFGALPFEETGVFSKPMFQRDCSGCHALGTALTRFPRTSEQWLPTVTRMHAYVGSTDAETIAKRAELLAQGFDGKPLTIRPRFASNPEIYKAKVYEYALPGILFPHDSEISHDDGKAYTVDRHGNKMIVTDLQSGESQMIDQPLSTREFKPDSNTYTGKSVQPGPHSLALGDNALWYTTNATSSEIGVFDANSRKWLTSYTLPPEAQYPHTIRIDQENIVWFTVAVSEHIGRLDPKTGDITLIDAPNPRPIGIPAGTSPYGIDIHPLNGQVWYARLFGDRIGYVDPKTLEITEYDSPVKGPRRLRFDAKGSMWLTGYNEGEIVEIETDTMSSTVYALPELAKGYRPAPYALGVHPQTQEIWVNDTLTDSVFRFLPDEERFITYPMPLLGTYTRDFSFTDNGWACTANSPIMNAALEEGVSGLICIDTGDKPQ